jgi:hypothetical protein
MSQYYTVCVTSTRKALPNANIKSLLGWLV